MLDEHGASKTVFAGTRVFCPYFGRHADVGLFLEPEDVEDASAVPQLGEERLDGMDSMQELKAVQLIGKCKLSAGQREDKKEL